MRFDEGDSRLPTVFPRLAERYETPALQASWYPPSRRKALTGRAAAVDIRIIELSLTGMMVEAPANKKVVEGVKLRLAFHGTEAIVQVENVRDHEHPERQKEQVVGLSIFRSSEEFEALVNDAVHKLQIANRAR